MRPRNYVTRMHNSMIHFEEILAGILQEQFYNTKEVFTGILESRNELAGKLWLYFFLSIYIKVMTFLTLTLGLCYYVFFILVYSNYIATKAELRNSYKNFSNECYIYLH